MRAQLRRLRNEAGTRDAAAALTIMYDWDSSNVNGKLSFLTSGRRMVFIIAKSQQRPVENWLAGMSSRPSDSGERSDAEKW